ncbi:AraC family transcriptional regulator [Variovorax sp. LjRoot290]|uniref:AraC family transcriptional regulator n=1 Tax=Variovorax sp. LjRoot290 TaxID=3342316 RepID=UPI003ED04CA2
MALPKLTFIHRPGDRNTPQLSVFGLKALVAEMESQGVSSRALLSRTGVLSEQFDDHSMLISRDQRLAIYRNAQRLAKRSDVALRAGARQRISDFGVWGYALASSKTLGDAMDLCFRQLRQVGPVLQITSRVEGGTIKLRSHDPASLGELLPFVAEFWRSSNHAFLSHILEAPLPSSRMLLPYPAPPHWRTYRQMFNCPVEFAAETMEWHFPESAWSLPLPNANPVLVKVCQRFCEQVLSEQPPGSELADSIRVILVNQPGRFPNIDEIAADLGMSLRTLNRRLASEGLSYQSIIDDVRRTLAVEYLERTALSVEEICERVGFSDPSNFRKAFRKWTGRPPSHFRTEPAAART